MTVCTASGTGSKRSASSVGAEQLLPWRSFAAAWLALGSLASIAILARWDVLRTQGRVLQASTLDSVPTLDNVETAIFSRPPYSRLERSDLVYYSVAGSSLLSAVLLLIGVNLDQAERRRRIARSIVPHEVEPQQFCCFRYMAHKDSVPCEITEQYYLDVRLLNLQTPENMARRGLRQGFRHYLCRYASSFFEVLAREHLLCSFLLRAIPTFTRVKRAVLIILQLHLCMATAAVAINIREHEQPLGLYEVLSCGDASPECIATLPRALISAAVLCPVFRFAVLGQMRLTCFISQTHPSSSRFPLGMRKFATLSPRSIVETLFCMRSRHERCKDRATQSRTCVHRAVGVLWRTTRSSANDLRFYSILTSWCVVFMVLTLVVATLVYVLLFTVYLKDAVVYHWLAWTLSMFFSSILVLEPALIFWTEVVWCALVASVAQHWGFGPHALAATRRYKPIVREIEDLYLSDVRDVASLRIQRWWLSMLDMYRVIHEQTAAAIKIQSIRKKMHQKSKYIKERKWCMKMEVLDCSDLVHVTSDSRMMSPMVRLMCDVGNPTVLQTKVAWESGTSATFHETFFVDIKESASMYVSVWAKDLIGEEFIGRGYFEFNKLKSGDKDRPEGHRFKVPLFDIQHGEFLSNARAAPKGHVALHVHFLDPLKEPCGEDGQEDWMLPKNRMKLALSKMNPGGRLKVGKMLGNLKGGAGSSPTPDQTPAMQPLQLSLTAGGSNSESWAQRPAEWSAQRPAEWPAQRTPSSRAAEGTEATVTGMVHEMAAPVTGEGHFALAEERAALTYDAPPVPPVSTQLPLHSRRSSHADVDVTAEFAAAQAPRKVSIASSVAQVQLHRTRTGVVRSGTQVLGRPATGRMSGEQPLGLPLDLSQKLQSSSASSSPWVSAPGSAQRSRNTQRVSPLQRTPTPRDQAGDGWPFESLHSPAR